MIPASLKCSYAQECGGCPNIAVDDAEQRKSKILALHNSLAEAGANTPPALIEFTSAGVQRLRDKVDFSLRSNGLKFTIGFYDRHGDKLLQIEDCPLMSEPLRDCYRKFLRDPPPLGRAAVRLRVAPNGQAGVWIDCSHTEIKTLLDQEAWLNRTSRWALVEIGQKRKRAQYVEGRWRLKKTEEFFPWFETYTSDGRVFPLKSCIGSFTQVGFVSNRLILDAVLAQFADFHGRTVLELGSGIGNFTLPLAAQGIRVTACELDVLAVKALAENLKEAGFTDVVQINRTNFYRNTPAFGDWLRKADALLVDPPRSGLGIFADLVAQCGSRGPSRIVYVSCFLESLTRDLGRLLQNGYKVIAAQIIDQFPHSDHGEYVVTLIRD